MKAEQLNSFMESAEKARVKEGQIEKILFDASVKGGHATGELRAIYNGLRIETLTDELDSNLWNKIKSFLANVLKIKNENREGEDERIGKIDKQRQADEPFFRFVWFFLRGPLGDIVGF
jgi:hypothetical protein